MSSVEWVEKYRPTSLKQFVFSSEKERQVFDNMVQSEKILNMTLCGNPGIGKTTLARILAKCVDEDDILIVDGSRNNDVETVRNVIEPFASTFGTSGNKILIIEEADYLSHASQAVLRKVIEDNIDNMNCILTCNFIHKLMKPLLSRCPLIKLGDPDFESVVSYVKNILSKENVKYEEHLLLKAISKDYPDLRLVLNNIQRNVIDQQLVEGEQTSIGASSASMKAILKLLSVGSWSDAREVLCESVDKNDYESVYRYLYDNIGSVKPFKTDKSKLEEAIITIADHLYKHNFYADVEINMTALFIKLSLLGN